MIKTEAVPSTKIVCGQCKDNLDCCDECNSWFMCGDDVWHEDYGYGDKHYCNECKEAKDAKAIKENN